jgi:rRNA biogenesis protein RRP5
LEFIKGDAEKGRSTYEALSNIFYNIVVQSYPKRTDIWSVYLDMEIKKGNKDIIRNLFERSIEFNF